MAINNDELLAKVDEAIYGLSYWIPRITVPENAEWWTKYKWVTVHGYKQALSGDFPDWKATPEDLERINKSLDRIINSMPPIRYGHPDEIAKDPTYLHGMSCPCDWCEERKEKWEMQ